MRKRILWIWFNICIILCQESLPQQLASKEMICRRGIAVVLAAAALRYWFTPDRSYPTLDQLRTRIFVPLSYDDSKDLDEQQSAKDWHKILQKGDGKIFIRGKGWYQLYQNVKDGLANYKDTVVTVYSGGCSNGGHPNPYSVYTAIKAGNIRGACVVFDYVTDSRRAFNFCQEQDVYCLKEVINEINDPKNNNQQEKYKIVLHGASKGASNSLRFLATNANHETMGIKAVIAESPVISVKLALKHWRHGGMISHLLCRLCLPNYRPQSSIIRADESFPKIPVLIGSLPKDRISDLMDVNEMVGTLKSKISNQVTHFISNESEHRHGKIGKAQDYHNAVTKFLDNFSVSS